MKDFLVGNDGDLVIKNNDLQFVRNESLTAQKLKINLSTQKGEWEFNDEAGTNFGAILGEKNVAKEKIYDIVLDGIRQIDETLRITEFDMSMNGRKLSVKFKAENDSGDEFYIALGDAQNVTNGSRVVTVYECTLDANKVLCAGNAISALCVCTSDISILDCGR